MNKLTSTENSRLKYILECELKEMLDYRTRDFFKEEIKTVKSLIKKLKL